MATSPIPFTIDRDGRLMAPRALKFQRGSIFRGGASVVASGPTSGSQSIAAGGSADFDIEIIEDCYLEHLVVEPAGGELLVVTAITVDNDGLVNNEVPASIFRGDSTVTPLFGHFVTKNSTIRVTVENPTAAAVITSVGFTALPIDSRPMPAQRR